MRCTRRSDHPARNARPVQVADPIFALISARREHRRGGEQPTLRCSCRTLASLARVVRRRRRIGISIKVDAEEPPVDAGYFAATYNAAMPASAAPEAVADA